MIRLDANNGDFIEVMQENAGQEITVKLLDSKGEIESNYTIRPDEAVMLLNYYQSCKNGYEESDYIKL